MSQTALAHLLASCQAGDAQAIAELVETYRPALFRLALSILDDPAEADEAAQDAFVAALGALRGYRREAAFTTWLYAITVNVCRGRLRRQGARRSAPTRPSNRPRGWRHSRITPRSARRT